MSYEPSSFEVFITVAVGNLFGGTYKEYCDRLGLRGDERVLDFGSGAGTPARYLAQTLARGGGHLTCVDISHGWIQVAQKRLKKYPNVEFHVGDIGDLHLPSASFDAVFLHFVLHDIQADERPRIVRELVRALAYDGKVLVREPLRFISRDAVCQLMQPFGLVETAARHAQVPTQGEVYEGVWQRGARAVSHFDLGTLPR